MSTASTPKHVEVYNRLRAEIANGTYAPGQRIPTELELVERYGVSRPTVARALGALEKEGQLERRRGSGTFLKGSVPVQHELLGLLVPRLHYSGIGGPIAAGISRRAESLGHGLMLASTLEDGDEESGNWAERVCEQLIRHKVRGIFFVPLELPSEQSEINQRITDRLVSEGVSVVLVDRDIFPYPERSDFDLVAMDNRAAGFSLCQHIVDLGVKKIAFVADHLDSSSALERIEGARIALRAAGSDLPDDLVVKWDSSCGAKAIEALVRSEDVEAILFVNDLLARDAVTLLMASGLRVPDDIRIAAFDDLEFSANLSVPLTTFRQPFEALGVNAVEMMKSRLAFQKQPFRDLRIRGQLVVRESCGVQDAQQNTKVLRVHPD